MTTRLIQKHLLKGTREFEIINDTVYVRRKSLFKEEKLTLVLSTLDPEPVVNKSELEFHSHAKNGPWLSLLLNKPNDKEFNAFVATLRQCLLGEHNISFGDNAPSQPAGLAGNSYEEPPEFDEPGHNQPSTRKPVDPVKVDNTIKMLETYVVDEEIKPLLSALEALKAEPQDESHLRQVENAFNDLGIIQGAILTYAPYISILLSENPP